MAVSKYYAVARGRKAGIYTNWAEAEKQVRGFAGARYKSFKTRKEAEEWLSCPAPSSAGKTAAQKKSASKSEYSSRDTVVIYTDGGSINNPGPGGYGIVQIYGDERIEKSGGYRLTTNNRMELMAVIVALRELKYRDKPVKVHTDSSYVVNGITKGWARNWRKNGWIKSDKKPAINPDLWAELLDLVEPLDIEFIWVKGHAGNPLNERCDELVGIAARTAGLPEDNGYKK